jgi:hypothetical protein
MSKDRVNNHEHGGGQACIFHILKVSSLVQPMVFNM